MEKLYFMIHIELSRYYNTLLKKGWACSFSHPYSQKSGQNKRCFVGSWDRRYMCHHNNDREVGRL